MTKSDTATNILLTAIEFASRKHTDQRRKDQRQSPYINHPIQVAWLLNSVGKVEDPAVLAAAILHDTVEDTATTPEELRRTFGEEITSIVMECTDDKSLPKEERKRLQVEHAPHKTPSAKCVKLGDKISNIVDISHSPPSSWTNERIVEYLDWAEKVVAGLRGANKPLEDYFDKSLAEARSLRCQK
jgi:(p)ppGpp synthase/HD superfamily hydrolase